MGLLRRQLLFAVTLLLAACGGGGGGSGSGGGTTPPATPLIYSGSTSAGVITPTNAAMLTANLLGNGDAPLTGNSFKAVAASGAPPRGPSNGLVVLARQLSRAFRTIPLPTGGTSGVRSGVVPIDATTLCDSGSSRTVGTLSDNRTGTLSVTFNDCRQGNTTLSGQATLRIDAFDLPAKE